ncbi:MAG: ABC transporter permease [Dehalococcoidales bacterium]|nr:MAG: ABC transporter permease [Dehalococcoidales bacterium]
MQRYIVKRLLQGTLILFLVSIIVFLLGRQIGDPVALLLPEYSTEEDRIRLTEQLGLDKSLPEQYAIFIWNALQGDLGNSIRGAREPALDLVLERVPASLMLASIAVFISLLIGIPLGVLAAVKRGSLLDTTARVLALLGQATPVFLLAIMGMYIFSVQLGWFPTSGYGRPEQFVLPVLTMSCFMVAAFLRLTRASMLEVVDSEYIKLARIKGLSERNVIWKHALRNSLIPVLTFMGTIFGRMISGAVIVETIFAWPGIGRLAYDAVMQRNYPVLQAVVLFIATSFLVINLLVDILYAFIDPRIRYSQ